MAVITPPLFQNIDGVFTAAALGLPYQDAISEGVVAPTHLAVTERGAGANMSVDVAAGVAWIRGDVSALQPTYRCYNDGTVNLAIAAANATNPRLDLVIAEVRDAAFSGVSTDWLLRVVTGTPAASPAAPATPNNAIVLARVSVPALDTTINTAQIFDWRPLAQLGVVDKLGSARFVTALPTQPYDGQEVYFQNAGMATDGVAWHLRYRAAAGGLYKWEYLGGAPLQAEAAAAAGTASTTYVDLASGPAVTLPLAGDYDVEIGCTAWSTTAGQPHRMSYAIGGTAAIDDDGFFGQTGTGTNTAVTSERRVRRKTGLAAVALTTKYKSTGGATATFDDRFIRATPVRVG